MNVMRGASTSPPGQRNTGRTSGQRPTSFPPTAGPATYRDLLRFEQRLKQNADALDGQRRKYQVFLGALVCSILLLGWKVAFQPSIYSLVHYAHLALLLIATTAFILFFATGMYSTKIARGYKFVPQANRSLRPLNMHLATRGSSTSTSSGVLNSMSHRKHARQRSSISEGSNDIPQSPSGHRLSELIFSSRVDPEFQKGYEQFRAEWERRKSSKESRGSVDSETSAKLPVTDSSRSRRHGSASLRGRRISRTADSADSSPAVSRSPSPPGLHSPHSRFTSSTSLSSAPEPTTPPDESDLELADLVDDHIKGRRSSKASSLHRIESDDEFEGR